MGERSQYSTALGPVEIAPFEPRDLPSILDLFEAVFGVAKSREVFEWQFLNNPVGVHYQVGREESGRVVSQFCAIPARFQVRDELLVFGQIIDTVVHPDHRAGLKRKGLYSATVDAFVERFGRRDREIVMMGLPNPPAFRIGRLLAGYVPMGIVYFHTRAIEPRPGVPELPRTLRKRGTDWTIARVDRYGADLDELWERLRRRHACIGVRDAEHMNWRYADCPIPGRYHLLELREAGSGDLCGIAVGTAGYLEQPDGVIVDWLVDREASGGREALLDVVEELMAAVSMRRVQVLMNPVEEESRFFEDRGYVLEPTHYRMVSRTYDPETVTPDWLARRWYYTLGDFDVV